MYKIIFSIVVIASITIVASLNCNLSENECKLSDLALANVEALASEEESITGNCGNMTPVICRVTCPKCGKVYKTKEAPGPASDVKGHCNCGHTFK